MPNRACPPMMAAARVVAPGGTDWVERPLPQPGPGEIRVRLEGCGVCASNLEPWAGQPWTRFPLAPGELGHEGWGRIEAAGEGVDDLAPGDRVAILGTRSYATHDLAPAALAARLPDALEGQPMPGEALGCAVSIFARARIGAGDRVAVVGAGFIGLLLIQLAAAAGARVLALARRPEACARARTMGAVDAIRLDRPETALARVAEATGGRMADIAIEAAGHQAPLDLAAALLREQGRLVIAGFHQGPRQVDMLGWNWRALDIVNAHERDRQRLASCMRRGIAAGRLALAPLLTHRFPLHRLGEALDAARDKPPGFVKGWVQC